MTPYFIFQSVFLSLLRFSLSPHLSSSARLNAIIARRREGRGRRRRRGRCCRKRRRRRAGSIPRSPELPPLSISLLLSQRFRPSDDLSMTSNKFSGEFASIKRGRGGRQSITFAHVRPSCAGRCASERACHAMAALAAPCRRQLLGPLLMCRNTKEREGERFTPSVGGLNRAAFPVRPSFRRPSAFPFFPSFPKMYETAGKPPRPSKAAEAAAVAGDAGRQGHRWHS